jgi:rare lipoprotein A
MTGCLHRRRRPLLVTPPVYPPTAVPPEIVQGQEGIASWYGPGFNGKPTSDGEIYNMYAMTAAHRTLPFGTLVRVHDLENGRAVLVRINDRGPFVEGRIIDLSYAAAQALGMNGTALVRLHVMSLGPDAGEGIYSVQVGAFLDPQNAARQKRAIGLGFGPVMIQTYEGANGLFYRVRVGEFQTIQGARALARQLLDANLTTQAFVVRLN